MAVYLCDEYLLPGKFHRETPVGILQPELQRAPAPQKLIDAATGKLRLQGWATGIEDNLVVNHRDGRPVSESHEALNRLRYRVWNYHLLYTEKHVIQFNFVDVFSLDGRGVCPSNIVIFEKSNPRDTMRKVEEKTFRCP